MLQIADGDFRSHSPTSLRQHRRQLTRRRLYAIMAEGLRYVPSLANVGEDLLFQHYARLQGFDGKALWSHILLTGSGPMTLIAAPNAVWYSAEAMKRLKGTQQIFMRNSHACAAIPFRAVTRLAQRDEAGWADFFERVVIETFARRHQDLTGCTRGAFHDPVGCIAMSLAGTDCHR